MKTMRTRRVKPPLITSEKVLNPNLTLRRYAMMDDLTTLMEIWVDAADAGMPRHPPTTADGTTLRLA